MCSRVIRSDCRLSESKAVHGKTADTNNASWYWCDCRASKMAPMRLTSRAAADLLIREKGPRHQNGKLLAGSIRTQSTQETEPEDLKRSEKIP